MAIAVISAQLGTTDIYHQSDGWDVDQNGSLSVFRAGVGEQARYAHGVWSAVRVHDDDADSATQAV